MNRQARRAAAKQANNPAAPKFPIELAKMLDTLGSLEEFARLAERLKPHLQTLEELSVRLEQANSALAQARQENSELKGELLLQRQIFLRMFCSALGCTFEQVLSIEEVMQKQIAFEASHADSPSRDTNAATPPVKSA